MEDIRTFRFISQSEFARLLLIVASSLAVIWAGQLAEKIPAIERLENLPLPTGSQRIQDQDSIVLKDHENRHRTASPLVSGDQSLSVMTTGQ